MTNKLDKMDTFCRSFTFEPFTVEPCTLVPSVSMCENFLQASSSHVQHSADMPKVLQPVNPSCGRVIVESTETELTGLRPHSNIINAHTHTYM